MNKYSLVIFDADGTLTPLRGSAIGASRFETLPGVREKCAQLRAEGVTLAIASNQSDQRRTPAIVQQLTWTCGAIGISDVGNLYLMWATGGAKKPSAHMLLALMKHYDISADKTLFVGDWETDRQAAEAAGVDFALSKDFFSLDNTDCSHFLEILESLGRAVRLRDTRDALHKISSLRKSFEKLQKGNPHE